MTPSVRKILLPTDFGPSSTCAAAYAAALARGLGASIHLVHVLDEPPPGAWPARRSDAAAIHEKLYHQSRDKLARLAASTLRSATDRITIEVRTGTPAESIVAAAIDYGADVIVMSAPGRSLLPNLLGSVAERVLRAAPCPVLAISESGAAHVRRARQAA